MEILSIWGFILTSSMSKLADIMEVYMNWRFNEKLLIAILTLSTGFCQPIEAFSVSDISGWVHTTWKKLNNISFSSAIFAIGALGSLSYLAYRQGIKDTKTQYINNQKAFRNFLRGSLNNRSVALPLPPIKLSSLEDYIKRFANNHLDTVWPIFIRLFTANQQNSVGRVDDYRNYFLYHSMTDLPGVRRSQPGDESSDVMVDWHTVYEYVTGKLYEFRQGFNNPSIDQALKLWSIYADNTHNLYQLPVLEQGRFQVPQDSMYYSLIRDDAQNRNLDGANCGYHALKNSMYLYEALRQNNKLNIIKQLTLPSYYLAPLYDWVPRIMTQPGRADMNSDDWLGIEDINHLSQDRALQNHITVVPRISENGTVLIDASGNFPHLNTSINNWPILSEIRQQLRQRNTYQHAFIVHVNHKSNPKSKSGPGHWISLVVHKANNEINFYVMNSLANMRYGYDNYHQIRYIIDYLRVPTSTLETTA
jgi:hypothetical protein